MYDVSIETLPQLKDFSSIPDRIGTTSGVFSHDRKWFMFRYGIVEDRMARWDESHHETALFVVEWAEFERLSAQNAGKPFDSWVPQCSKLLLASHPSPAGSDLEKVNKKPR